MAEHDPAGRAAEKILDEIYWTDESQEEKQQDLEYFSNIIRTEYALPMAVVEAAERLKKNYDNGKPLIGAIRQICTSVTALKEARHAD